jgi:hypothetical protein
VNEEGVRCLGASDGMEDELGAARGQRLATADDVVRLWKNPSRAMKSGSGGA